jgi:hypothetical protein
MEIIWYILEIIRVGFPAILIMGMIAIPLIWILHNGSKEEWESLNKYYNGFSSEENQNPKQKAVYKITVRNIMWTQNVRISFLEKTGNTTKDFTRFRFKFVANLVCWILNKGENGFVSYRVVKIK